MSRALSNDRTPILVIGAAGPSAGLVVPELVKRGARVRGFVRNEADGAIARAHGAAEIAVGDLRERPTIDAALVGVRAVFYIPPAFIPREGAVGVSVVEASKRAGVQRFVFSSVIHPILHTLSNHGDKALVEEALINSELEYVFLHPTVFFQNLATAWPDVIATGVFAEPWATDTRFSRVDYRDVAEVAAIALTEDRLNFGTYELCAEGQLDRHGVAALMSRVTGRPIRAERAPQPSGKDGNPSPMKPMFDWYDRHGLRGNALTLRAILGREPRSLEAYLAELAATPGPVAAAFTQTTD